MNVSVYIKEPLLAKVKEKAKREGISVSKLVELALEEVVNESIPSVPLKNLASLNGIVKLGGDAVKDAEKYYE